MAQALFPESISAQTLANACAAFAEVAGFDPKRAYFPLHVDSSGITFPAVVTENDEGKKLPAGGTAYGPNAVISVPIRIEVQG